MTHTEPNPIKDIQDKAGMYDFGRSLVHIWRGILAEADNYEEAIAVMKAWSQSVKEDDSGEATEH